MVVSETVKLCSEQGEPWHGHFSDGKGDKNDVPSLGEPSYIQSWRTKRQQHASVSPPTSTAVPGPIPRWDRPGNDESSNMHLFCPTCGNLLAVEEGPASYRFACNTCPYVQTIAGKVTFLFIGCCII